MSRTTALIYVRKSQVKSGGAAPASPELQEQACRAAAAPHHWMVEVHVDAEGHRSGKTANRPGWQAVRARLADPEVAALIVHSHDRAFRNLRALLEMADECQRLGVRLVLVKEQLDVTTAQGRFMLSLLGSFGEFESNIASERRVETIEHLRRERGRHYGLAPFGTERRPHNGDRALFPSARIQPRGTDHAALVRLYEIYVAQGLSNRRIAVQLNAEGWHYRDRYGRLRPWSADDVRRALASHWLYSGLVTIGRAYRDKIEFIRGNHAPILPDALTAAVAARLASFAPRRGRGKRAPRVYPLTGLLFCAGCGARLRGGLENGNRRYVHPLPCAAGWQNSRLSNALDAQVQEHIATRSIPPELMARHQADVIAALAAEQGATSPEAERQRLEQMVARLQELYVDGEMERADYDRRKASLLRQMPAPAEIPPLDPASARFLPSKDDLRPGTDESIRSAPPVMLRDMARSLYERITVGERGELEYKPRAWCVGWAG